MSIVVRRYPGESRADSVQRIADHFYTLHGPCCAGCDWWRGPNSTVGTCHKAAPVAASERVAMLGVTYTSMPLGAGHPFTPREHLCGDFKDDFDWSSLSPLYLKRIGRTS